MHLRELSDQAVGQQKTEIEPKKLKGEHDHPLKPYAENSLAKTGPSLSNSLHLGCRSSLQIEESFQEVVESVRSAIHRISVYSHA